MEITIRDLVVLISELAGYRGEIRWDRTKPDGQPKRCLDVSRAKKEFAFEAAMPFREGLKRTIAWYLQHSNDKTTTARDNPHC
jgi:GDP-L-fucose synthase